MVKSKRCNFIISAKRNKAKFKIFIFVIFSVAIILSVQFVIAATVVDLGTSSNFVILSKSGITDVPNSIIIGDVGTTPISGSAIGVTCPEVTGTIFSVDGAGPLPCRITNAGLLNTARIDMEAAYTDAAGRTGGTIIGGNIGGLTILPGIYTITSNVIIPADVILSGNSTDVWIFQIGGDLAISSAKNVILSGGAQASNVFWQVAGTTTLGTYSVFNGNILAGPGTSTIALQTGAKLCGRALGQKDVTLNHNYLSNICGTINATNFILTTIILSPPSANLAVNSNLQLNSASFDQFGLPINATIIYSSSNSSVAIVNSTSGLVTAIAPGNSIITATSGNVSATSLITVKTTIHKTIPIMDDNLFLLLIISTLILGLYGLNKYGR